MFFAALATDYDGTLAKDGRVDAPTVQALREVKHSGRKLILVTGRVLPELQAVFPELDLFDLVVAENGALLFNPAKKEETPLAEPLPAAFVERLRELGVSPLSVGRTIVATWEPHQKTVLSVIRELALELHIVFNKGAVMALPSKINKAWGLKHALGSLCLSPHNVVGIGDAENDQAFLSACGCAVAVGNALPSVKAKVDLVVADHGKGVARLAHLLTERDMRDSGLRVPRHQPILGVSDCTPVCLSPFDTLLITGSFGGGKSTVVTALLEQIRDLGFQFCVVDPVGDYSEFRDAVVVGDSSQEPQLAELMSLLAKPYVSVVVNLQAIDPPDRPRFLANFLPEIAKLRSEIGRPHWVVLNESHHYLDWEPAPVALPKEFPATIVVTVHSDELSPHLLDAISTVVGVGSGALTAIEKFCRASQRQTPSISPAESRPDYEYILSRDNTIELITPNKPTEKQRRHARKYAQGELGEHRSFYFRGPDSTLNLRAQNLSTFLQMAAGVDDRTWLHHLQAGEYSRWFQDVIKDEDLAEEASVIESDRALSAQESRTLIKRLIDRRYTAPAKKS